MKSVKKGVLLLLIAVTVIVFVGCDLLFDLLGSDDEVYVLVLDLDNTFFTDLGTSSLAMKINGETVKTIADDDITGDPTSFNISYTGEISSVTLTSGAYSELYNALDDFISNDDSAVTAMAEIKKIRVYAFWNFFSETYTGIGAKVEPLD